MACLDKLQCLIDKQDTAEIVRDRIAQILANETENQQELALRNSLHPDPWRFDVTVERSNAFEKWLNDQDDLTPIVNVWFDSGTFDKSASDVVKTQKMTGRYNIDCYACARAKDIAGGGHEAGDQRSAFEAQRIMRLCRNILMASQNTYLQLRGTVWGRWVQSVTLFQPRLDNQMGLQITGARVTIEVDFNEYSPQFKAQGLDTVTFDIQRSADGFVLAQANYEPPGD